MSDPGAFLVGRATGDWPEASVPAQDLLFAAIRKDGESLKGLVFAHCTFANVSFKDVELNHCRFINCAFLNCYFRKTQLVGSSFVGCKFISCEFPKARIQSCDFKYSRFDSCALTFDELEHSLPREPNLREALCHELAIASDILGIYRDARKYRLKAIEARQEHLKAAVLSQSEWYESHYPGVRRVRALLAWVGHSLNGVIWGHGEKWQVLLRNLVILALGIFPLLLWLSRPGLSVGGDVPGIGELIWLSVTTMIPVSGLSAVEVTSLQARVILVTEGFVGIVTAGLFVALLVRGILRR